MAVSANVFGSAFDQALQAKINWASDTLKMALLTSSASPNLGTWVHFSDVTNETTGTGYTAGGATLGTVTHTVTVANSWGVSWAATTAYTVGQIVRPTTGNGFVYRCVAAGTSGASQPTWSTTVGEASSSMNPDGSVVWVNAGESVSVFSSAAASWTASTISAQYGVIYDSTPGTSSTDPLICLINFGTTVSSTAGTYTVTPDSNVGWFAVTPA